MMSDGGCGGAGYGANHEPLGGSFEARQEHPAADGGQSGVPFLQERGRARFFVGQIFLRGLGFEGGGAAVLQIVVKRLEVELRDGNGGGLGIGRTGSGRAGIFDFRLSDLVLGGALGSETG